MIARRDDGAMLARLDDGECAVVIDADGRQMWAASVTSALSRGDWENAEGTLEGRQHRRALRLLDDRFADGVLDCGQAGGQPDDGSRLPGIPAGIRPR